MIRENIPSGKHTRVVREPHIVIDRRQQIEAAAIFLDHFRFDPVRGKNVLLWLLPFALAPLPTLMLFILFLQRKVK